MCLTHIVNISVALFLSVLVRVYSCLGTSKKLSLGVLIGVNHACISIDFSVFFIAQLRDSLSISVILCYSRILYCSIEYGNVGKKRAARRQENKTKAEIAESKEA